MGVGPFLSTRNARAATFSCGSSPHRMQGGGVSTDSGLERTHSVNPQSQVWNETAVPACWWFYWIICTLSRQCRLILVQASLQT